MLISFLSKRSYILAITYQYQIQTILYKHKSFSYAIWQTVFITVLWNSENGRQQQQQLQQQRTASTECSPTFCACDPNLDRCQQGFPNNRTKPGSKWRTGSTHTVSNSALTHPYKTPTMRSQLPTSPNGKPFYNTTKPCFHVGKISKKSTSETRELNVVQSKTRQHGLSPLRHFGAGASCRGPASTSSGPPRSRPFGQRRRTCLWSRKWVLYFGRLEQQ